MRRGARGRQSRRSPNSELMEWRTAEREGPRGVMTHDGTSCAGAPEDACESLGEQFFCRQQTDDEERFVREVEKEAWMHEDVLVLNEIERERFLAARCRHANHSRPPTLDREHVA